jgi:S-DNA-T family DNA segregation ATPase FtsK/SpoIIIE
MLPLTINGPIPFGWHRDDTVAAAELRSRCALAVGETGSGKSNLLQNLNAGLVRCPDALVWHIDLGGAGMSLPWLGPWLDGETDRPVIDWVAADVPEAIAMTECALAVITRRRLAYRREARRADVDMLPLTHQVPGVYIVLDEGAEAMGVTASARLQANLVSIIELGRSVGVRVVLSALRATSDVLPARAKRQLGLRVGMRVTDPEEINHLFGWSYRPDPEDTPYPGCGLWRDGAAGPVRPFRSWDLTRPSSIGRVARACQSWRPTLDGPSLAGAQRELYEGRWERVRPLLDGDPPMAVPAAANPGGQPGGGLDLSKVDEAIAVARILTMPRQAVDARVAELEQRLAPRPGPAGGAVEPRARMLELLDAAGPDGLSGDAVLSALRDEGVSVARSTVFEWLRRDAVDGGYGRWITPRHRGMP